jgi:RNA polymerase sigma factor (TIGR02999 family)
MKGVFCIRIVIIPKVAEQNEVATLLRRFGDGDKAVLDQLVPLVYDELHRMASSYLRGERYENSLQTTALIHEAYLRLAAQRQPGCEDPAHFYGIASRVMRQILVDHARTRLAQKRGGMQEKLPLESAEAEVAGRPAALIALNDALTSLEQLDPGKARLVELRFFAGLTAEESARLLSLPVQTVRSRLRVAQAWLRAEIDGAFE